MCLCLLYNLKKKNVMNHVCVWSIVQNEYKKMWLCFCSRIVIYVTAPLGSYLLTDTLVVRWFNRFFFLLHSLQIWLDFTNSRNRFPTIMLLIRYLQPFKSTVLSRLNSTPLELQLQSNPGMCVCVCVLVWSSEQLSALTYFTTGGYQFRKK